MKGKRRVGLLTAWLLTTIVGVAALPNAHAQDADRVLLPGHVLPVISERALTLPVVKAADANTTAMGLTIVLRRNDEVGFERLLAQLYDPASPEFRRWRTPQEIADRFGPSTADYQAVESWFRDQGFAVAERSENRMTLSVSAPRSTVENALRITIADYKVFEPAGQRAFYANREAPSLPPAIAARIQAIGGLSTLARARPATDALDRAWCYLRGVNTGGFTGGGGTQTPYDACKDEVTKCTTGKHIAAVNADIVKDACKGFIGAPTSDARPPRAGDPPVAWKDVDGTGQKVGITAFDTFNPSDVADYLAVFGYPATQINKLSRVAVNGGATPGADQSEVLLDIDTLLVGAPGAQIVVYDAPFGAGAFQALFNRMLVDQVSVISNSWAYCENQTSAADVQSIDSILAAAAAAGVSVFNAAGDSGSTCLNGSPNTIHVPAGSPNATAVGGTSLVLGPGTTWSSESWWGSGVTTTPSHGQGGFGVSRFFARPFYQNGFTVSPFRSVPDVAFHSDPTDGVAICQAAAGGCPAPLSFGGTSYAAPAWAIGAALMNQAAGHRFGLLNPQIYALAASGAFHGPAELGSDFAHVGLGSPNFNRLFLALTGTMAGPVSATESRVEQVVDFVAANGTNYGVIVVKLRDAQGNMVAGKTVTLTQSVGGHAIVTPPSAVTTAANGAAIFEVRSATVENLTFTATDVTDGVVLAQTVPVTFAVPPATAGGISAFPTTVLNNGTATTTITVTLQDAQGNPTPGKVVALSQGGGHSIITAPSPAVTAANGQIQFTATNKIAETVTYTAVDVTDGDLPVPGSAIVTFSGQASVSCAGAITAAPGFMVTPFATGFIAEAFPYSNVNWGCGGASNPTFDPTGFYIASFRTGELFKLPPQGGAASTANRLSTPGLTLQGAVFGKDGKLYTTRAATGSGFFSGQVLELDPQTGATLRILASNLPCATGLAVDPISGDLFFTGQCFGAGSDSPGLFRVSNPGSATPAVSTYATLPGTPNGAVSIAPDGTLFVAVTYLAATPPVVRVSGTNQPQPPTVTPVPGVNAVYWVTVGETLPGGAAKSLIVNTSDQKLRLADITTDPPTFTELLTTGASSGVVGPDGCLYTSNGETVYKLTSASGTCGFTPTTAVPSIALTPTSVTPDPAQGTQRTLTAQLVGVPNPAGMPIIFRIAGANNRFQMVRADANGEAQLTYLGSIAGTDTITAETTLGTSALVSNRARLNWVAGKHVTFVSLNLSPANAVVAQPVTLIGTLIDAVADPQAAIAGVTLQFNVAGQSCNATTNASGVASCAVTIPLTGNYTLTVAYAGDASFLAATDSVAFAVLAAGVPPCFAFNDVDSTSVFCANVEWIRNRAVTLGCAVALYCPNDDVFRLNMAAFMNRLGTVLSPTVLFNALEPGAIDLDAQPVVCQTSDFATGVFTRRAVVDASFSGRSTAGIGFAADAVASFDGGATWIPLAAVGNRAYAGANQWGHARARGVAELDPSQTVRFGLWISRGGQSGTADLTDSRCTLRAAIGSR